MREFLARYMPPDYSLHGRALDQLSAYVHWLMLILFVGWGALFLFMLFRFNRKRNPKANYHGTHSHLSTYAEVAVLAAECVLVFGISIPAWSAWTNRPGKAANPLEVRVVGEQFAWNIHYPGADGVFGRTDVSHVSSSNPLGLDATDPMAKDDVVTLNQLHLEVNRPVIVRLTSKDVIHSFFLPVMRVKQDATPGMEVPIHFTPVKTSEAAQFWDIACAQLCGLGHYRMKGQFQVHSKQEFQKWFASQQPAVSNISG